MKRGNGSAALCAVSNWIWQYIIRFSSIHQFLCKTCLYGRVSGAASLVMMPEQQLWGNFWLLLCEAIQRILEGRFLMSEHWLIGHNKCPASLKESVRKRGREKKGARGGVAVGAERFGWQHISKWSKWPAVTSVSMSVSTTRSPKQGYHRPAWLAQPGTKTHLPFTSK